jgi:hypothetical protein
MWQFECKDVAALCTIDVVSISRSHRNQDLPGTQRTIMQVTSSMVQKDLLATGNAIWRAKINAEHNIQQAVRSPDTRPAVRWLAVFLNEIIVIERWLGMQPRGCTAQRQ